MALGLAYWIIMLLWFVLGVYVTWGIGNHYMTGGNILLFLLFFIIGWKLFGPPIRGG